jgi:DNA polymerase epsilon subunit 1
MYPQVCQDVKDKLALLRDTPNRLEKPMIYHLDVSAMYPNIILTNRLQVRIVPSPARCSLWLALLPTLRLLNNHILVVR